MVVEPAAWSIRKIGDFASRSKVINVAGTPLPPLSITKDRGVVLQSEKYKKQIATDLRKYVVARRDQFAFDPMSLYYGAIGRVARMDVGLVSPDYVVFDVDDSVDKTFLNYLLRSPSQVANYEAVAETGNSFGKRRRVYWSVLEQLAVRMPPLGEQRKIAAILSTADAAIETAHAVIERLYVVKKALMSELMTRGLPGRHTRFKRTEIGEVPAEWDVELLEHAGEWLSGGTPSKQSPELWTGDIPWVSPKDMKRSRIGEAIDHVSPAALGRGTRLAPVGSLFLVVRGMILAHSLPVAITVAPVAFNQDIKALVPRSSFDGEFLLYWLQSQKDALLERAEVSNHGTKRLPSELLFAAKLIRPPIEEQRQLASILRILDERIATEEAELDSRRALRAALMTALLVGEIRVTPDEAAT